MLNSMSLIDDGGTDPIHYVDDRDSDSDDEDNFITDRNADDESNKS